MGVSKREYEKIYCGEKDETFDQQRREFILMYSKDRLPKKKKK
jgi:hypothetical protein